MSYTIHHYVLQEKPFGLYERGEGSVHGTEFGGDSELFETIEEP